MNRKQVIGFLNLYCKETRNSKTLYQQSYTHIYKVLVHNNTCFHTKSNNKNPYEYMFTRQTHKQTSNTHQTHKHTLNTQTYIIQRKKKSLKRYRCPETRSWHAPNLWKVSSDRSAFPLIAT